MVNKLGALPYYGGKQGFGKAQWIADLLPWIKHSTYVEPFGGMMGVLLTRDKVNREIYNDLDSRLLNWWRVVRKFPQEFGHMVQCLPHSREEHQWAKRTVDNENESAIDRALAFHCLAVQSAAQNLNGASSNWRFVASAATGSFGRWRSERVAALAERVWDVCMENRPADDLLERLVDVDYAIIYCDPPYLSRNTSSYNVVDMDVGRLTELFKAQRSRVAISGMGDEWDHLGWEKHGFATKKVARPGQKVQRASDITEIVWTNYDVIQTQRDTLL